MTINWLEVDLTGVFECGMTYVALSRGVDIRQMAVRGFAERDLKTSRKVIAFYECLRHGREWCNDRQSRSSHSGGHGDGKGGEEKDLDLSSVLRQQQSSSFLSQPRPYQQQQQSSSSLSQPKPYQQQSPSSSLFTTEPYYHQTGLSKRSHIQPFSPEAYSSLNSNTSSSQNSFSLFHPPSQKTTKKSKNDLLQSFASTLLMFNKKSQ